MTSVSSCGSRATRGVRGLATPTSEHGLGLGTFMTSVVFLLAILDTVVYLSVSRVDVIEDADNDR